MGKNKNQMKRERERERGGGHGREAGPEAVEEEEEHGCMAAVPVLWDTVSFTPQTKEGMETCTCTFPTFFYSWPIFLKFSLKFHFSVPLTSSSPDLLKIHQPCLF